MKAAKAAGAVVSFDLNFREKLWNIWGGERPRGRGRSAGSSSTWTSSSATRKTCRRALGIPGPEVAAASKLDPAAFFAMIDDVVTKHPQRQDRRDDAARGALDEPPQLGRGRLGQRPDVLVAHVRARRARPRRRRRRLRVRLLLRPADGRDAGGSREARLGARRAADDLPRRHDDGDRGAGAGVRAAAGRRAFSGRREQRL